MPDDYAIAAAAAQAALQDEIRRFVPVWAQNQIPADLIHNAGTEVGKAVVDALAKAHAAALKPGDA